MMLDVPLNDDPEIARRAGTRLGRGRLDSLGGTPSDRARLGRQVRPRHPSVTGGGSAPPRPRARRAFAKPECAPGCLNPLKSRGPTARRQDRTKLVQG